MSDLVEISRDDLIRVYRRLKRARDAHCEVALRADYPSLEDAWIVAELSRCVEDLRSYCEVAVKVLMISFFGLGFGVALGRASVPEDELELRRAPRQVRVARAIRTRRDELL